MAEFSLKDTLIGGGLLFGIGVFLKSKKGKKKVNLDYDNWGGNPDGKLAKALAKAREESKKPREPLKIERLDAETEDSPPIEYSAYRRRINYLEMIYNAFYDPESSIYQLVNGYSSGAINYGEGFILPTKAIFLDLRSGSSQLDGQRLSFNYGGNRGSRNKLKTNVKNALQRASGTKLSSSGRLHHGGLIGADYEYNGKMFFIRYNMRGRGNSRRTTLSVASQDSIPEYRRGEYPFSRAYEHENDYRYQGSAEAFDAEFKGREGVWLYRYPLSYRPNEQAITVFKDKEDWLHIWEKLCEDYIQIRNREGLEVFERQMQEKREDFPHLSDEELEEQFPTSFAYWKRQTIQIPQAIDDIVVRLNQHGDENGVYGIDFGNKRYNPSGNHINNAHTITYRDSHAFVFYPFDDSEYYMSEEEE